MAAIYQKRNFIFGVHEGEIPPLDGFPDGRIKLRIRQNCFAEAFVKTSDGIQRFFIEEKEGKWTPLIKSAENKTYGTKI